MSADSHSLVKEERVVYRGLPALMFWTFISSLLLVATVFGGMTYFVMVLAIGLAIIVWMRPQEAVGAGMLYLFVCHVVFPSAARFGILAESAWEMYYWAAGLLIITTAAVARLGLRRVLTVPPSAKVFLAVAFAAAAYGETHGAATSYVFRQFYGVLLLIVYLGIALHAGDEELLLRRIRTFGVLISFCFFVYYVAVFPVYGFHKEMGFNGAQASLLAIVLFVAGLERRKLSWVLGAILLLLVPILLFLRSDVLTFLVALPTALAIKLKSKKLRILCWSAVVLMALPSILPPAAQTVMNEMRKVPVIENVLPEAVQDADTLYERWLQLAETVSTVQAHPFLGEGLGSALEWDSPTLGLLRGGYVDSGWGYLLQKMGLLGAAAFLWFLITILRNISRASAGLSACLLAAMIVTLFSQPAFFHFTTAPYLGTFAGLLLAKKYRRNLSTMAVTKQRNYSKGQSLSVFRP
jgi:hypothetical protein